MRVISRNRDLILLTIGTVLITLSVCLILYDKYQYLKDNVINEIELEKYKEGNNSSNMSDNEIKDVNTKSVDDDSKMINNDDKKKITKEFIGYLQISKINLKQGLVSKNSYYNHVDRNIQILAASDYPDKEKGNVILASHSGSSSISYFKNLYKLSLDDKAVIFYKGYVYEYKIVKIYNVAKVGSLHVYRDTSKSCLTLITCTKNSKTEQTVYILELVSKKKESDG